MKMRVFIVVSLLYMACVPRVFCSIKTSRSKNRLTVRNGDLSVTFMVDGKKAGSVVSAKYKNKEYLNPDQSGGIRSFGMRLKDGEPEQSKQEGKSTRHDWQYQVLKRDNYTEVLFSEKATKAWPMSTQIGWIFREGEPGFYYYLNYHHSAKDQNIRLQQTRMNLLVAKNVFQKAFIEKDRIYDVTPFSQWKDYKSIMDATYLLTNGKIITKYSWSTRKENQRYYGYAGRGMGIFHLFPSMEHVNGGPNKQSNTEHHTPEGPTILNVMSSSHYGAGQTDVKGEWSKLYGPFFVLLTDKKEVEDNFSAAESRQQILEREWPFKWFKHENHVVQRGTIKGRVILDGKPASNAQVLLTTQRADNLSETLNHGLGQMFWARTDRNGEFSIQKVIPGEYFIHVYQAGLWQDYHTPHDKPVAVRKDTITDAGDLAFSDNEKNTLVWQIGIPDRNSTEFRGAINDAFRPYSGMFGLKPAYNGDNPVFTIGASDPAQDFYYAHPVFLANLKEYIDLALDVPGADHSSFETSPVRKIQFELKEQPKGPYRLTLAFASSSKARLEIKLNGRGIGKIIGTFDDSAAFRSGSYGRPSRHSLDIKAKWLKQGSNLLSIGCLGRLKLIENPAPRKKDKERKHGTVLAEDPGDNKSRLLKGSFSSAVLYDAIKLEQVGE